MWRWLISSVNGQMKRLVKAKACQPYHSNCTIVQLHQSDGIYIFQRPVINGVRVTPSSFIHSHQFLEAPPDLIWIEILFSALLSLSGVLERVKWAASQMVKVLPVAVFSGRLASGAIPLQSLPSLPS